MSIIFSRFADAVERVMQQSRKTVERDFRSLAMKQPPRQIRRVPMRQGRDERPRFSADENVELYQDFVGEGPRGYEQRYPIGERRRVQIGRAARSGIVPRIDPREIESQAAAYGGTRDYDRSYFRPRDPRATAFIQGMVDSASTEEELAARDWLRRNLDPEAFKVYQGLVHVPARLRGQREGESHYDPVAGEISSRTDKQTMVHELAHAWDDAKLTPQQRTQFVNDVYALAQQGDDLAQETLVTNIQDPRSQYGGFGDPMHMFTYVAEQLLADPKRIPPQLLPYFNGFLKSDPAKSAAVERVRQGFAQTITPIRRGVATAQRVAENARSMQRRSIGGALLPESVAGPIRRSQAAHDTAGDLYDIARTEIPGAQRVANVAGDLGARAARGALQTAQGPLGPAVNRTIEELTPAPNPEDVAAGGGAFAGETLVPVEVWQAVLELVPGVGTVPGAISAVRKGSPEAVAAFRRVMASPRFAGLLDEGAQALRGGERGALTLGGEGDELVRGADKLSAVEPEAAVREYVQDSHKTREAAEAMARGEEVDPVMADRVRALQAEIARSPVERELYRGIVIPGPLYKARGTYNVGDEISIPLASASRSAMTSANFAAQRRGIPVQFVIKKARGYSIMDFLDVGKVYHEREAEVLVSGGPFRVTEVIERPIGSRTTGFQVTLEPIEDAGRAVPPSQVDTGPVARPEPVERMAEAEVVESAPTAQRQEPPPPVEQPLRTPVSQAETGSGAPQAPEAVATGGGSAGGPPGGLVTSGPVGPEDRIRVAKQIARGVERQGPEFVQQEAIRSQQRSQRAARLREIRRDKSLSFEERKRLTGQALSGEYFKGDYLPMEMADSDFAIALNMVSDSNLRDFEWRAATVALARLRSGQGLREFEQTMMGQVFGPDVLRAIKRRNASLASRIAEMWGVSAEDVARAARQEEITRATGTVKQSALDTQEQIAARRIDTADAADRQRFIQNRIKAQNRLAEMHLREVHAAMGRGLKQTEKEITSIREARTRDLEESITQAVTRGGPKPETAPTDLVRSGIRDRDGKVLTSGLDAYERQHPSVSDLMKRAGETVPEESRPVVSEAIRYWSEGNRAILDGVGETEGLGQMLRLVTSAFSGQVTDSYVANLTSRRAFLEMALLREGIDPKDVGKVGQFMFDSEVKLRYGENVPEGVQRSIDMLKSPALMGEKASTSGTILEAMARASEEVKNMMFGVDLGVFGIQARAAVQGGWIPELASLVNKTLTRMHLPAFGDLYLDSTLDRQTANMLDGVFHSFGAQGPEAVTRRGIVMNLPGYGKTVDKLTDFQFNTVLGAVRDTLYEGNLLLLHVLRRDIKNPRVRARAAEWANTLTGFAHGAQTGMRKKAERAFFISPSMTRAQFNEILSAGKLLSPTADPEQRILAALAIASYGTSWLAAGQLINNVIGIKDFEFDPSKAGAGTITTKIPGTGEQSIPFMANASLKRTFAQSLRALAETNEDDLWRAWARYLTAREATSARGVVGLTTGAGYTPEGKFSTDISREDLATSLLPLPPVAQSAIYKGPNPVRLGLESFGINAYERSDFDKADELIAKFDGDFQAALFDAEGRGETGTADIVKYRWKQDLTPTLESFGLKLIPGEPKQSPRIEYEGLNKVLIPQYADRFQQELGVDVTGAANLSEIRDRFVEREAPRYAQARGTSLAVAKEEVRKYFNASEVVKGTLEQQFRQDGTPSQRTKDNPEEGWKKGDPIYEHGDDGYEDIYDQRRDAFWQRFPEIEAALRILGVDH